MPRVNFNDEVWSSVRFSVLFLELSKRFPDLHATTVRQLAAGSLISAWRLGQTYWTDQDFPNSPIPNSIWQRNGMFDELITADFAEPVEGGIRMRGSKEGFDWIINNQVNGQKGGNAKKSNDQPYRTVANASEPKRTVANASEPNRTSTPPTFEGNFATSSDQNENLDCSKMMQESKKSNDQVKRTVANASLLSQISDLRSHNTNTNTFNAVVGSLPVADAPAPRKPKSSKPPTEGTEVWNAYRESMLKTWGMDPPRSAKTASQATQLVGLVGLEKAKELAAYYPTRRSQWYVTKGHPIGLLLTDHMALLRELSAGMKMTKEVVDEIVGQENLQTHEQLREMKPSIYSDEWDDWYEKQQQLNGEKRNELLSEAN